MFNPQIHKNIGHSVLSWHESENTSNRKAEDDIISLSHKFTMLKLVSVHFDQCLVYSCKFPCSMFHVSVCFSYTEKGK